MKKHLVMTLTGPDKVGLVDRLTQIVYNFAGNVESSKMARLGGEFVVLMMVSIPEQNVKKLQTELNTFVDEGYNVYIKPTSISNLSQYKGWLPFKLQVDGADHEGIIHNVTHYLADKGINIENMDTSMTQAPMSGTPLFMMTAVVVIPPEINYADWRAGLDVIGHDDNVAIEVVPYKG